MIVFGVVAAGVVMILAVVLIVLARTIRVIPQARHDVRAEVDSVCLLTVSID